MPKLIHCGTKCLEHAYYFSQLSKYSCMNIFLFSVALPSPPSYYIFSFQFFLCPPKVNESEWNIWSEFYLVKYIKTVSCQERIILRSPMKSYSPMPRKGGLRLKFYHNKLKTLVQLEYFHKAPDGLSLSLSPLSLSECEL